MAKAKTVDSTVTDSAEELKKIKPASKTPAPEKISPQEAAKREMEIVKTLMNLGKALPKQDDLWYPQTASLGIAAMAEGRQTFDTLYAASQLSLADAQSAGGNVVKAYRPS